MQLRLVGKIALLLFLSHSALPALAAKPVSVKELEQSLAEASGQRDAQIAHKLADLELTQRLDSMKLSRWLSKLPGPKAQEALLQLADMSAFLDLPASEVLAIPAPNTAAQRHMLSLSLDYINKTIHELPNLFATRVTTSYLDTLWEHWHPDSGLIRHEPFRVVGRYSADVLYRDGGEDAHSDATSSTRKPPGLQTSGEFGLLGIVLEDAVQSKLSWSHWEQGAAGSMAIYRYSVPAEKSHYKVGSSWLQKLGESRVIFQQFSGYEGEIAIDPSTGTILRLVLRADTKPTDPLEKANILVEYGPVLLDGKTYICPVRSVAISIGAGIQVFSAIGQPAPRLLHTSLNDVTFERYHLFRADARIVPRGV